MPGELRLDPLTGEWVNIVGHRQGRPNLPEGCPFCVGGLEAPDAYDTRWFPNRWPAYEPGGPLDPGAGARAAGTTALPASGAAEVVLYSPRHEGSLGSLGREQIAEVIDLWAERTSALLARPEVRYVLVFESRGEEVGATIHHPHGQIYGYPFVPPSPREEARRARRDPDATLAAEVARERADGRRVVADRDGWVAYVPFASAYPYGMRVAPVRPVGRLDQLDPADRRALAVVMEDVLTRYDRLWAGDPSASAIFPYLMWWHQAPADDDPDGTDGFHLHLHLAPPQRAPGLARFVAAGELGSGTFSNPVVPEAAAEELRSV